MEMHKGNASRPNLPERVGRLSTRLWDKLNGVNPRISERRIKNEKTHTLRRRGTLTVAGLAVASLTLATGSYIFKFSNEGRDNLLEKIEQQTEECFDEIPEEYPPAARQAAEDECRDISTPPNDDGN